MTRAVLIVCVGLCGLGGSAPSVGGAESESPKYTLRYRFRPGETIRWDVEHRTQVRTTVSGTTQRVETVSRSVKVWRVQQVNADGSARFEHLVESVDMRHRLSGCNEVRYNSKTDKEPPLGFQQVAKSVGVPLWAITLNARGKILRRERRQAERAGRNEGPMTIPLPAEPVPVGHRWSFPHVVEVSLSSGAIKKVKTRQSFTLEDVRDDVATIRVATCILTPIDDPAIESQLVECEKRGTVRFDVGAGRVVQQRMGVERHVVGFRGHASSLHYVSRFQEKLLPAEVEIAARLAKRPDD